eukprot:468025-Pyramimonas_sp.AAC.1
MGPDTTARTTTGLKDSTPATATPIILKRLLLESAPPLASPKRKEEPQACPPPGSLDPARRR